MYMKLNIKLLKTIPSMEVYSMENCGKISTNDDKWRFSYWENHQTRWGVFSNQKSYKKISTPHSYARTCSINMTLMLIHCGV